MAFLKRERILIVFFDLWFSLFSFWLARYFGDLPRWYWLVLSAVIWVIIGILSGKLQFGEYKRVRYAWLGIISVDALTGGFLYLFYKYFIPTYAYDNSILLASGLIICLEISQYHFIRKIYYRNIPYFYEETPITDVIEKGLHSPLNIQEEIWNKDLSLVTNILQNKQDVKEFKRSLKEADLSDKTAIIESTAPESVLRDKVQAPSLIILLNKLNDARYLNTLLSYTNYCLPDGGYAVCHCTITSLHKQRIMRQTPVGINYVIIFLDYLFHRIIPKISFMKPLYYWITKGRNRAIHRVELLGKLYRAGFEVIHEEISLGEFYVIASKQKAPIRSDKPNTGTLIRLKRIGKDGKEIGVYKFRTMYTYSEYLQPYIYKQEGLCKGGKIADDYRVTPIGRFLRCTWLDELPMLINWIRGDMKLVGIRPLSLHYYSLYSKEVQELRIKTKPGLLPPFYADMPETLDEIQESERRYLKAYLSHPAATDWRYFWKAFRNIVLRGKRSK
ncbi:sugar transferase [uncultured Bacteroides sp.]|uniref:sugar transferase n=1 Tax=uncultured Bacteroides sp. TaxID=162156 RepID=UPI002AA89325|nr:sugar transferase [uncultured Bacteroides sp.]